MSFVFRFLVSFVFRFFLVSFACRFFIIVGEQPTKQECCPRYSAGKGIDLTWWGGGQPDLDGINIDF